MKIYLSGPMSGRPNDNFPTFNAFALSLRSRGYEVVNPAEIEPEVSKPSAEAAPSIHKTYYLACLKADIKALCDCDCIALLPGWESSSGAHLELHIAHRLGLMVKNVGELLA